MQQRRAVLKSICKVLASVLLAVLLIGPAAPLHAQNETITLEMSVTGWGHAVIEAIQNGAKRFEALHPNVKVEVVTLGTDGFISRMAAGVPPDLMMPAEVAAFSERGLLMSLDAFVEKDPELRQQVIPQTWDQVTWNGQIWGVPALEHGPRLGLVWDHDAAQESGIAVNSDEVLTWSEFFDAADKMTRISPAGELLRIGYNPRDGQNHRLYTMAALWDAEDYFSHDAPRINHPRVVEMLQFTSDRFYGKYQDLLDFTYGWYAIASGHSASTILGAYASGEIYSRNPGTQIQVSWPPSDSGRRVQLLDGWSLAIPTGAPHPELSYQLIRFMVTDTQTQLDIYNASGFLGSTYDFYAALGEVETNPAVLWYLESLDKADYVDVVTADPFIYIASDIYGEAAVQVFRQEGAAKPLLDEAQRILEARMREEGRL